MIQKGKVTGWIQGMENKRKISTKNFTRRIHLIFTNVFHIKNRMITKEK